MFFFNSILPESRISKKSDFRFNLWSDFPFYTFFYDSGKASNASAIKRRKRQLRHLRRFELRSLLRWIQKIGARLVRSIPGKRDDEDSEENGSSIFEKIGARKNRLAVWPAVLE